MTKGLNQTRPGARRQSRTTQTFQMCIFAGGQVNCGFLKQPQPRTYLVGNFIKFHSCE
uniref:Uncharacterized protein n=1 Tax=Anguilla anguilla TaxID=7936 RepID=A0A0E9WAC0_ANGAN